MGQQVTGRCSYRGAEAHGGVSRAGRGSQTAGRARVLEPLERPPCHFQRKTRWVSGWGRLPASATLPTVALRQAKNHSRPRLAPNGSRRACNILVRTSKSYNLSSPRQPSRAASPSPQVVRVARLTGHRVDLPARATGRGTSESCTRRATPRKTAHPPDTLRACGTLSLKWRQRRQPRRGITRRCRSRSTPCALPTVGRSPWQS